MRRLAEAGLTTREACGNSVRNVTACPCAGVAPTRCSTSTPYAEAVTRHFLRHPLASSLPRKFKVAFEGCPDDHAATRHPRPRLPRAPARPGGARGFRVRAAGGTSTVPDPRPVARRALPAGELLELAEAMIRVFHPRGRPRPPHANRMKFLVRKLGFEGFRAEVEAERARGARRGRARAAVRSGASPGGGAARRPRRQPPSPGRRSRRASRPRPLARSGRSCPSVARTSRPAGRARRVPAHERPPAAAGRVRGGEVALPLGDVTAAQLRALAELSRAPTGTATVRLTASRTSCCAGCPGRRRRRCTRGLAAAGLGQDGAAGPRDVTSCPGAESCKLAVTAVARARARSSRRTSASARARRAARPAST